MNVLDVLVALAGLVFLFRAPRNTPWPVLGWIFLTTFLVLGVQSSKPYYLDAAYPALLAAGGAAVAAVSATGWWRTLRVVAPLALLALAAVSAPFVVPVLPIDRFIAYQAALGARPVSQEKARVGVLAQHYADRFGWEELARAVALAWGTIPDAERPRTAIVAGNYGEAGAITYYGRKLGLPPAFSQHNSYYLWGPPDGATVFVIAGQRRARLEAVFSSVTEVARSLSPYAMPYETDQRIYVCRGLKVPLPEAWRLGKHFI
jgi:hypothetical protein